MNGKHGDAVFMNLLHFCLEIEIMVYHQNLP